MGASGSRLIVCTPKRMYIGLKRTIPGRSTHTELPLLRIPTTSLARRFQEWLLERYHPKMVQQKKEDKIKWVAQESAVFAEQLRANPVAFIASAALDPISEVCYFSIGL